MIRKVLTALVLLASLLLLCLPAMAQPAIEAIDGDTLRVGRQTVRVIGLDAPEMRGACDSEIARAVRARDRLADLVARGVTLEPRGLDRHGRLLAVVRDAAGRDLALVMIAEGHARPYTGRGARAGWC